MRGEYEIRAYDIEGCFPNMPKKAILLAAIEYVAHLRRSGQKGVWVPRARTKRPDWCPPDKKQPGTWIPLQELVDLLEFALENAFIKMPNGQIWKQMNGIPMGDPLSPGMTILTCSWMEKEWLAGMQPLDTMFFRGARYMDDILLFLNKSEDWDYEGFIKNFEESTCYWKPLNLEASDAGTFLESTIFKVGDDVSFRLKNQNEFGNNIWRYHDYRSRLDYTTKRAILISTLRKVDKMASDR